MQDRAAMLSTIEVRLKDMDRMGIDIQAVSPAPQQTYYWTEPGLGVEVSRMINDRLAEIVAKWPERFVGLGTRAAAERRAGGDRARALRQAARSARCRDHPNVAGKELTDPSLNLDRFFARRESWISSSLCTRSGSPRAIADGPYLNNIIGNPARHDGRHEPFDLGGVMERHPD